MSDDAKGYCDIAEQAADKAYKRFEELIGKMAGTHVRPEQMMPICTTHLVHALDRVAMMLGCVADAIAAHPGAQVDLSQVEDSLSAIWRNTR